MFVTQMGSAKSYFGLGSGEMGSHPTEAFHTESGNEAGGPHFCCNWAFIPKQFKCCLPPSHTSDRFITDTPKIFFKLNSWTSLHNYCGAWRAAHCQVTLPSSLFMTAFLVVDAYTVIKSPFPPFCQHQKFLIIFCIFSPFSDKSPTN